MLNVYDIKIDSAGTNAYSNITGDVVFDTNTQGRIILSTENIRENGNNLYFSEERKNESTSFYDNLYVRNNDKRLFNENIIVVKKNPGLGEFSSLVDALASVTDNAPDNFIKVSIGPGEYIEPEIFVPAYVSIVGEGIQNTTIIPDGNHHVFHLENVYVELSFFGISNASSGFAGIYIDDAGDFTQAHKITFNNCHTNILVESNTQDTLFYGEYIDYNGVYAYGTRIISNNGFKAFANLENYYNLPTGGTPIGTYVSGSNAICDVLASGNIGVNTGTGFYAQDGADLKISSCNIDGWNIGIHNGNIGEGINILTTGSTITNNTTYDIFIEHPTSYGSVIGVCDIDKVSNNSENTISLAIQGIQDGSLTVNGTINGIFGNVVTDISTLLVKGSGMGLMYSGLLYSTSGLQLNLTAGFGYLTKTDGTLVKLSWNDIQYNVPPNVQRYVYFNENGNLTLNSVLPDLVSNIYLGRIGTTSNGFEFISNNCVTSDNISNSFAKTLLNGFGAVYSSGSIVTENISNPRHLDVTQGIYYIATTEIMPSGGTDIDFNLYFENGTDGYLFTTTNVLSNTHYNGTNGGLIPIPSNKYAKYSVYTVSDNTISNAERYFVVYPQAVYDTLLQAQEALLPIPPAYFNNDIVLIASVIVRQGVNNIIEVRDNRPILGSTPQGISASANHSSLLNLNNDDHTQYLLVSGARAMSGNLNMNTNNITNVGTVNGITVETHASRHLPNGADPLATGVASSIGSTNQEGIANAFARQDHVHAISNSSITYAKLQNVSGNKILGNAGVAGSVEELALTSGLAISGLTVGIATNGVTNSMLRQSNATSVIGRWDLTSGTVNDISATADGQFLRRRSGSLGFGGLNSGDIPASSVTFAKIQNITANRLLGRVTSTGIVQELALSSGLAFSGASLTTDLDDTHFKQNGNSFGTHGYIGTNNNTQLIFKTNNINRWSILENGNLFINGDYAIQANLNSTVRNIISVTNSTNTVNFGSLLSNVTYTSAAMVLASANNIEFRNNVATNASRYFTATGNWTLGGTTDAGFKLDVIGNTRIQNDLSLRKGIDYSSSGAFNNVPTTNTSNIRFTSNTPPTISGFGQGVDGKILYVTNTGTGQLTILNNSSSSLASNRIITGKGQNVTVASGSTVELVYDSTSTVWRLNTGVINNDISLTGDITGSGSAGIATTIANNAVTYAKIQNISANRILGRVTSSGTIQELALSSGLAFSGASIIATGGGGGTITLTGDVTGSGSAGITTTIANDAITTSKIINNAVTYAKMQNVNGNRILGNVGGLGLVEELALTSGLSFSGNTIGVDYTNSPYKNVCRVRTTANLTATYSNGASGVGATLTNSGALAALALDGVTLSVGDRVLVMNQTTTSQNGIYVVTTAGSGAVAWVMTRATDSDTATEVYQASVTVKEGTTFSSTQYVNSNTSTTITLGTTNITYLLVGGYTISTGLTLTNRTITIANGAITRAMLANGTATTVIGRSANSTGAVADISATSSGQVLKRNGTTLGFHNIGNDDIANSAIAYAKIQNVTANRILGRVTSTGSPQELAVSSGLAFSGASLTTDSSVVTLTGTQTLTNKTITSGRFNQLLDTNGNVGLLLSAVGSANYLTVFNGGAGASPKIVATGSDTNLNLQLESKGTGTVAFQVGTSYLLSLPTTAPTTNQVLQYNGSAYVWGVSSRWTSASSTIYYGNNIGVGQGFPSVQSSASDAIHVDNGNNASSALKFTAGPSTANGTRIGIDGQGNAFFNVRDSKKIDLLTSDSVRVSITSTGEVQVGSGTFNSSAILDIATTSKGFGLPTMTKAQMNAISTPKNGLMVYNTESGTAGIMGRIDNSWRRINSIFRQYQFSMSGSASSTIGLLSKASDSVNTSTNPSGLPTTSAGNPGINNGGIDPYQTIGTETIRRMRITFAGAAVSQASVGSAPTVRIDIYTIQYSARTLVATVRVPISATGVGASTNTSGDAFQTQIVNLNVPLGTGAIFGAEFVNESSDNNKIVALRRLQMVIETEE